MFALDISLEREDGCPTLGVMRQELDILLKVECFCCNPVFGVDRTEYGYLENPQLAQHSSHQEPVAVLTFLRSPHGMKQYECGRTQPLLRMGHDHGKLEVETYRVKTKY
jgi:hypothetical protein